MKRRVLSGIRGTGALHLGHHHFALKNWVKLQDEFDCCYFVADWHARTTHDQEATLFIQRRLPEHAELFTLLAMGTPLAWLERVPSYKDQIEQLTTQQRSSATAQQNGNCRWPRIASSRRSTRSSKSSDRGASARKAF